jgi:hypothetical protein
LAGLVFADSQEEKEFSSNAGGHIETHSTGATIKSRARESLQKARGRWHGLTSSIVLPSRDASSTVSVMII